MNRIFQGIILSLVVTLTTSSVKAMEIAFTEHIIGENFDVTMTVRAVDLDQDGDVDVIGGAYVDEGVKWWENDGNQNFIEHALSEDYDTVRTVEFADIDGDGDVDVVSAAFHPDRVTWWENDGDCQFTEHLISDSYGEPHTIYATDVDGDLDIDVLCSNWEEDFVWFENDGNQNFTDHAISPRIRGTCIYALKDEQSIVQVYGASYTASGGILWWENDGAQNFTEHFFPFPWAHWVYATDVDGDDDIDILGAACGSSVAWWENNGNQNFTMHTLTDNLRCAASVYAADMDNDGDIDILSAGETSDDIKWWENNGQHLFIEHSVTGGAFDGASDVYVADVDGDGDPDVLGAGNDCNRIEWWESDLIGAHFQADPITGHAPLGVQFTDASIVMEPITVWRWDFNSDGLIDAEEQHPFFTYEDPGTYTVSLHISSDTLEYTKSSDDYVRVFDGESALEFTGQGSHAFCSATPSLNLTDELTVEAWVHPSSWGNFLNFGLGRLIDKDHISLYLVDSYLGMHPHSAVLQLTHSDGTISYSNSPEASITLGQWQHVAVTYRGTGNEVKMYVDGIERVVTQSIPPSGPIEDNSSHNLVIGNDVTGSFGFDGIIDEVRLWNIRRTGEEIQTTMDSYLSGMEPGLVGYWKMNEGNGETSSDFSAHGNIGILTNVAWIQGINLNPAITDGDEDGVLDFEDNCPNDYNPDQEDDDGDTIGDVCDNCPGEVNPDQVDGDNDGSGDACDACMDTDGDGYGDPGFPANECEEDNCPQVYNPDQAEVEIGNIDCQGAIDVLDVLTVVNHILGTIRLIGDPLDRADCNGDGGVDILDALGMINVILGIGECVPIASERLEPGGNFQYR